MAVRNYIVKAVLLIGLLLTVSSGSLFLARNSLVSLYARNRLLPLMAQNGMVVEFDSLSTDFFSTLSLKKATLNYSTGPSELALETEEIFLRYRLIDLLRNWRVGLGHSLISGRGTKLIVRIEGTGGNALEGPTLSMVPAPPSWFPALRVTDGAFLLKQAERTIEVSQLGLDMAADEEGKRKIIATAEAVSQRNLPVMQSSLGTAVLEGSLSTAALEVDVLSINGKNVAENCRLSVSEGGSLLANGELHLFGGGVDFHFDLNGSRLGGSVQSRDVALTELSNLVENSAELAGKLSIHSFFDVDMQHPEEGNGQLRFELTGGRLGEIKVQRLLASLDVQEGVVRGDFVELESTANLIRLSGLQTNLTYLLQADSWQVLRSGKGKYHLVLKNLRELAGYLPEKAAEEIDSFDCDSLSAYGELSNSVLLLSEAGLHCKELTGKAGNVVIRLPDKAVDWQNAALDGEVSLTIADLTVLERYFPESLLELSGGLQIDGKMSGRLRQPEGELQFKGKDISFGPYPAFSMAGEAELRNGALLINKLHAFSDKDRLKLEGKFPFDRKASFRVSAEGHLNSIEKYLEILAPELLLQGDIDFGAKGEGTIEKLLLQLRLQSRQLSHGQTTLRDFSLASLTNGRQTNVERLQFTMDQGTFSLSGSVERGGDGWQSIDVLLRSLDFSGRHGAHLTGSETEILYRSGIASLAGPLSLSSDIGDFQVMGRGGRGLLDLQVRGENLKMPEEGEELFGKPLAFDQANFSLHLTGSPEEPRFDCEGSVVGLSGPELPAPFDGYFSVSYGTDGLEVRSLLLDGGESGTLKLEGRIPALLGKGGLQVLDGPLEIKGVVDMPDTRMVQLILPQYIQSGGSVQADMELGGTLRQPLGCVNLRASDILPSSRFTMLPPGQFSVDVKLKGMENRVRIDSVRLQNKDLQLEASGELTGNVFLADLLQGKRSHGITAELDIKGKMQLSELAWASERLPGIRRFNGTVTTDFIVRGPIYHPVYIATLSLDKGEVRSGSSLPVLRSINGKATVNADGIKIVKLQGLVGGSPAEISGAIQFSDLQKVVFDLRLQGRDILFFRNEQSRVRGNADIRMVGPLEAPTIEGEVLLTEGFFGRTINLLSMITNSFSLVPTPMPATGLQLFSITTAPFNNAKLRVSVRSEKSFKVSTNLAKGELRPDLLLTGTGELPQLIGNIYVEKGRMNLPAGTLVGDNGLIRFLESDPDRPFLEMSGNAKMMGYEITAKINGPYDEPAIDLSSYPPLNNADLLMLLLAGQPPAANGANGGGTDVSQVAIYLGRDLLRTLFGMEYTEDESIFDRLQLDIGRDITQQGEKTIEAKFLLKENLLLKNDAVFLSAEKDIWDDYNGGLRFVFRFQ